MLDSPLPSKLNAPGATAGGQRRVHRVRVALALVPGAVTGALFVWLSGWESNGRRHFTLFDDAMISMSYGRTLARSGELVWYEGAPRVEGFSNPLWTLLMAGLHACGLSPSQIALAIMAVGWGAVLATGALGAWLCLRLRPQAQWAPPLAAFTITMTYPFLFWSLRGMEVGLVTAVATALVATAVAASDRSAAPSLRRAWLLVAVGLVVIGLATRLDFAVLAAIVAAWIVWQSPLGAERIKVAVLLGGVMIGTLALLTASRYAYYGEVVPNTYWLKVSGVTLWTRLERGFLSAAKLAFILALAATGARLLWRDADLAQKRRLLLLLAAGFSVVAYSVWVGGDAWEYVPNRFVTPLLVCAAVLALTGAEAAAERVRAGWPATTWTLGVLALFALGVASIEVSWPWRLGVLVPAAVLAALWLFVLWRGRAWLRASMAPALAAVALLLASSGIGYLSWWLLGGQYVDADRRMAEEGRALGQLTKPEAVIAVVWAGAPVYYSERPAVDLLGKSDRAIAMTPPRGSFRPGHDRWDYGDSILGRRPDLVHQLWEATAEEWHALLEAGYEAHCFEGRPGDRRRILVRRDSALVERSALLPC
jgi:arabinofuranosyltransferase